MTDKSSKDGESVRQNQVGETGGNSATGQATNQEEAREYDHRGVLMPRRTRIGGIIVPQ